MSRAFIKEDADSDQVIITARPPLPAGQPNLVTPAGLAALNAELDSLREEATRLAAEQAGTPGSSAVRRLAALDEEIPALEDRLRSAVLVPTPPEGTTEVILGAVVTVRETSAAAAASSFSIVGVDEANPLEGLVAFTAPIAQALLGQTVGSTVSYEVGGSRRTVVIEQVSYS